MASEWRLDALHTRTPRVSVSLRALSSSARSLVIAPRIAHHRVRDMNISARYGFVGRWYVGHPLRAASHATDEALAELTHLCGQVLTALAREDLLRPRSVTVDEWFDRASGRAIERPDEVRALPPAEGVADLPRALRELMAEVDPEGRLLPTSLIIVGPGSIFLPTGVELQTDVFWIEAGVRRSRVRLSLHTQSDAWLPHTLWGDPQPEVHRLNAPRLESLLRSIEAKVGEECWPEVDDRRALARPVPYGLENITYDDGTVCTALLPPR